MPFGDLVALLVSSRKRAKRPAFVRLNLAVVLAMLLSLLPATSPGGRVPVASAHNLNQRMVYVFFDPATKAMLDARIPTLTPPESLLKVGDELGMIIKVIPTDGTSTGVGGYVDFYVPNGVTVLDAAYVLPNLSGGYDEISMKGQALMPAVGAGGGPTVSLVGIARGPNVLGLSSPVVDAGNVNLGTTVGVYGDTGIFYSSDPETAYNSWVNLEGGGTLTTNSGDTISPFNAWDAEQLAAYGIKGTTNPNYPASPIIDSNGRGNAPWGFANVVAGPQSGYAWQFDYDAYAACDPTPKTTPLASCIDQATQQMGPWKRIRYPGSQISDDPPGSNPASQPYTRGADGSNVGHALSPANPLPATVSQTDTTSPKAIRWAVGQLTNGRPEYVWVQVRVNDLTAIVDATGCPVFHADTFGGDAGGESNGKDHEWRYYDPTEFVWNGCLAVGKPANKMAVQVGETFQYTVSVYNASPTQDLVNVVVRDTLPSGVQFISAVPAANSGPNPLVWNVGSLKRGQRFQSVVTVKATSSGTLDNTVVATGSTTQTGQPVSSTSTEATIAGSVAILKQSKTVNPTAVAPGDSVQYTLRLENLGSGASSSPVRIEEHLPAGFSYASLDSVTVNGANAMASTTVNAGQPQDPIFSVAQPINPGKALVLKFSADTDPGLSPGSGYCNVFTSFTNTPLTTGSEACVTIGGGAIGDTVYRDWNGDGSQDPATEEGIAGVAVNLYAGACPPSGGTIRTDVTDSDGRYLLNGLTAGEYCVETPPLAGHSVTGDPQGALDGLATVSLATDEENFDIDFGLRPVGALKIGDLVFEDMGNDGNFDPGAGDAGIPNVRVDLYEDTDGNGLIDPADALIATTSSGAGGIYTFAGLAAGFDYIADVDDLDADVTAYFGGAPTLVTTADPHAVPNLAGDYLEADFGFYEIVPGSIGDEVCKDSNNDGSCAGEELLPNVTVNLYRDSNGNGVLDFGEPALGTTSTDIDGIYGFANLPPGNYIVDVNASDPDVPGGYSPGRDLIPVSLGIAQNRSDVDFPFVSVMSKTVDKNRADPGETLTYSISAHYPGSELLSKVVVVDNVPAGTTYAGNASPAPVIEPSIGGTGVISWSLGSNIPGKDGTTIPAVTLLSDKDSYINEDKPAVIFGAGVEMAVNGNVSGTKRKRPLVEFDLSAICPGSILTAELILKRVNGDNDAQTLTVRRATQAWTEASTTWTSYGSGGFATAGTDPSQVVTGSSTTVTWDVTAIAKQWCDGSQANRGFLLTSGLDNNKDHFFSSSEGGIAPKLKINGGGPEFSAPAHVTTSLGGNDSFRPSVAYDSSGVAHLVFRGKGAGDSRLNIYYSNDQGSGSWTTPVKISPNPPFDANDSLKPEIVVDGSDELHVVFEGKTASDSKINAYYRTSTNGGASWSSATDLSNDLGDQDSLYPHLAVDSIGVVHAVFQGKSGSDSKINIYHVNDQGNGSWTSPAKITPKPPFDTQDSLYPRIAIDGSNVLHVVFEGKTASDSKLNIYYLTSTNGGTSWGGVANLSDDLGGQDSKFPDLAADSTGVVHVVFEGKNSATDSKINIYYVNDQGSSSWTTPIKVSPEPPFDSQDSLLPRVSIDAANVLHLVFQGQTGFDSKKNVYHNTVSAGVPGTAINISKDLGSQDSLAPDVALSAGEALVVFQGKDGSKIDIFASRAPLTAGAANLSNHLAASPTLVGDSASIIVKQTLTSDVAENNIVAGSLNVTGANGAAATGCGSASLISADDDLDGTAGDSVVYRWTCTSDSSGITNLPASVSFDATAAGNTISFAKATSNSVLMAPTLSFQAKISGPPAPVDPVINTATVSDDKVIPPTDDDAVTAILASIGDRIWGDLDGDGIQDPGEPGLAGVEVCATPVGGGATLCDSTDASGIYRIYGLDGGLNYIVKWTPGSQPAGYVASTPTALTVTSGDLAAAGDFYSDADFGLRPPGGASIGDTVWIDADEDGVFDLGESRLPGVKVELYDVTGTNLLATTTTDANGNYSFGGLYAGNYVVWVDESASVTTPYGVVTTIAAAMELVAGSPTNPVAVNLPSDTSVIDTVDFGYNWAGSIGDTTFYDDDGNGLQNGAEPVAPNVVVTLNYDTNGNGKFNSGEPLVGIMSSDAGGNYLFDNLPPGDWFVKAEEQTVESQTQPGSFGSMVPTTGEGSGVSLAPSENYEDADFGFIEAAVVEGHVFHDANHNGLLDGGEPRLSPVTVSLSGTDSGGNPVNRSMITDGDGEYKFILPPGTYTITYSQPEVELIDPGLVDLTTPASHSVSPKAGQEIGGLDFGIDHRGSVGDTVYRDGNGNGVQDPGDPGQAGVTLYLHADLDSSGDLTPGDVFLGAKVTDAMGRYRFLGLADGDYLVRVDESSLPVGYNQRQDPDEAGICSVCDDDGSANVNGGSSELDVDFGYQPPSVLATHVISGRVYADQNNSGDDEAEPGFGGVNVTVVCDGSTFVLPTNGSGAWQLGALEEGTVCTVLDADEADLPSMALTATEAPATPITVNADISGLDFGYFEVLGSVAGSVCEGDGDGQCTGEPALSGVDITLTWSGPDGILGNGDDQSQTLQTGGGGDYLFGGLEPGLYQIVETNPAGYQSLADADGGNPDNITTNLALGQDLAGQDFEDGLIDPATNCVGDQVFFDIDNDGLFEPAQGEFGLDSVQVQLFADDGSTLGSLDPSDSALDSATSAGGGRFLFCGLPNGDYLLAVSAGEFAFGASLEGFESSSGNDQFGLAPDPDDDLDGDDNGMPSPLGGVATRAVSLAAGTEPDQPVDGDGTDSNATVDLGFTRREKPTGANLGGFRAEVQGAEVQLRWWTISERDVAGFNLYRSRPGAASERVNPRLILSENLRAGSEYVFRDRPGDGTWHYWLELVDSDGSARRFGALVVEARGMERPIYLPAVIRWDLSRVSQGPVSSDSGPSPSRRPAR